MAALLGARTSGHVVAYDPAGSRVFSGGITASRGHEGDSAGHESLVAGITAAAPRSYASVFGCTLARPDAAPGRR